MISSAEPPETHPTSIGISAAKIRVAIAGLEGLAPDLASAGEVQLAIWARDLSSRLYALMTRTPGEHAVVPPAPPPTTPNTGV